MPDKLELDRVALDLLDHIAYLFFLELQLPLPEVDHLVLVEGRDGPLQLLEQRRPELFWWLRRRVGGAGL